MRIRGDGIHYHVVARCNNGERLFNDDKEFRRVLSILGHYVNKHECKLFNYVIMPSHVHLVLMTDGGRHIDVVMHDFCLGVARDYNLRNKRGGHFWRHRYRSKVIYDDRYALACLRYIDRNPVKAGLVDSPRAWRWSGHLHYAYNRANKLLSVHPSYDLLGGDKVEKARNYRMLVGGHSIDEANETYLFESRCHTDSKRYSLATRQIAAEVGWFLWGCKPSN